MSCESISKIIPLYYYGELTPDEEERVDEHTHQCAACAREMEQQRILAAALETRQLALPPLLLEDCRSDLWAAIQGGAPRVEVKPKSAWRLFLDAMSQSLAGMGRFRQPLGALALLTIGFFAARLSSINNAGAPSTGPGDDVYSTVRSVQPDSAGGVSISFDETRRKVLKGRKEDEKIRQLLLAATHEDNPAVRVESVGLLTGQPGEIEVRDALLTVLAQDPNRGVRLKAIEGLKPLAADSEVRKGLRQALQLDEDPAVRMQVIDLLVAHRDDNMVGVMQGMVQKENNNSVRLKLEKALREMNASIGTF